MSYKMSTKRTVYERGDAGIGRIRFSTDGKKVQVKLQVAVGKDKFEERTYAINRDNCPEYIGLAKNAKDWMIQMSGDNHKMLSFRPAQGVFIVKTQSFSSKEGEEPVAKLKEVNFVRDGKQVNYSYEYFTVILEIVDNEQFNGVTLPLILRYNFAEVIKDGKSFVGFSMGGKYTQQLEEYMLVAGLLEEKYHPMTYSDNILPALQRLALREDRKFQVTVKDGWIIPGSLIPYDDAADNDDMPFDESEDDLLFDDDDGNTSELDDDYNDDVYNDEEPELFGDVE